MTPRRRLWLACATWVALTGACTPSSPPAAPDTAAVVATATPQPADASPVIAEPAVMPSSDAIDAESAPLSASTQGPSAAAPRAVTTRAVALVEAEVSGLERLLASTPARAPDRARILERLANDYAELAGSATADGRRDAALAAHQKAVEHYGRLQHDYPTYSQLDEALFALGNEHLALGDRDHARRAWFELIQKYPQSKLIPNAYNAFGELFFEEAASDPSKLQLAKQAYLEVLKYPPPNNQVWGHAQYKLGWIHYNLQEFPQALAAFRKVVEYGDRYAGIPASAALAREARKDLVRVYAQTGRPDTAWVFLRGVSGDTGPRDTGTVALVSRLGETYLQEGRSREALELYNNVATDHPTAGSCRMVAQAMSSLRQDNTVSPTGVAQLEARVRAGCGGLR